jgi:hypothetical protein
MSEHVIPMPIWKSRRHQWRRWVAGPDVIPMPLPPLAVLGLTPPVTADQVKAAYRRLSKTAHPDHGGSVQAFVILRDAYERALAECA